MEKIVKLNKVTKVYGKKTVLDSATLSVKKGEIYGLIGPSGAGKTTMVKVIVGMEKANQGQALVLNEKMPNLNILQDIGYMAQADSLYTELTGEENLKFFASLFKLNKAKQKERIAYSSALVNLSDDMKKKVGAYSGGMKRRLSLAVALIQNPQLLILDEPTVGIDPELRVTIWTELLRLKKEENKTIIITTHVMDEAERCDCLAMIRNGHIIATGSPKDLKSQYKVATLEEVFLKAGVDK